MQDFFPTMTMKPNDACDDYHCRLRQKEHQEYLALNPTVEVVAEEAAAVIHEDNEWGTIYALSVIHLKCFIYLIHLYLCPNCRLLGISLVDESTPVDEKQHTELAPGIHAAYDLPASVDPVAEETVDNGLSLEELMAQMKSI